MNNKEEIDDKVIYLKYLRHLIMNYLPNELSISMILCMVVLPVFILSCRFIINCMISLCTSRSIHYMPQQRAIEVVKYFNPFMFHLHNLNASYKGIKCTICSKTNCFIVPLWNVPIYDLFKLLHQVNLSNINRSISDFTVKNKCGNSSDLFFLPEGEELTKEFQPPEELDFEAVQTSCPRLKYPFVLIMFNKTLSNITNPEMMLLANIIHIPDQEIKLPAELYLQYAKSSNGYLGIVKKIYPGSFESSQTGNELCVVCMSREISVVVVPCGHICLCQTCFELCKNCPICRGPIHYYFVSNTVSQS